MAIFVPGVPCLICGQPVRAGEAVLFPPFTPNPADPLYAFSDGVAHAECFEKSKKKQNVLGILARLAEMRKDKICHICQQKILSPDDYFAFFLLTHDPASVLSRWNFTKFHRACLRNWKTKHSAVEQMERELNSGRWQGTPMEELLRDVKALGWPAEH